MKKIFFAVCLLAFSSSSAFAQTIENRSRSIIGYIWENGTVENSRRSTIGYAKGAKTEHAAAFFFFFFKPEK